MLAKRIRENHGYSLVETMAAMVILAVMIIPMVAMFDGAFNSVRASGDYDTARALANLKLEQAKGFSYATIKTDFPTGTGAPGSSGSITSSPQPAPAGFSGVSSYTVEKQYLEQPSTNPASSTENFRESLSATDTGLIRVTVTVTWAGGNMYSTTGLKVAE